MHSCSHWIMPFIANIEQPSIFLSRLWQSISASGRLQSICKAVIAEDDLTQLSSFQNRDVLKLDDRLTAESVAYRLNLYLLSLQDYPSSEQSPFEYT